jgi:methanogenic corrinoid protein MtbC1
MADILAGRLEVGEDPQHGGTPDGSITVADFLDRMTRGDLPGGETCFEQLSRDLDPNDLVSRVIVPAIVDMGERWFRRECEVHHERFVTGFLRGKLATLIDQAHRANVRPSHSIVIGTVQGDRHEGGVLMLHLLLEHKGWTVVNLGVDTPVGEYRKAVEFWRPDALGLSFVLSRNIKKRFQELAEIQGLPIFVGGRSILNYQGLARRNGLIPLPGPIIPGIDQLQAEYRDWLKIASRGRLPSDPPSQGPGQN